jgi:hypothetical protein
MRKICLEQLPPEVQSLLADAQSRRILVTRDGEPFLVAASVGFKDEEDLALEESPEFWQMIRERRREKASVSLEELKAEIEAEEQRLKDKGGEAPAKTPVAGA